MVSVEFTENFFWVKNGLWYVAWRHERKHGPQGLFLGRSSEWVSTAAHEPFPSTKYSSSNTKCQRNKGPLGETTVRQFAKIQSIAPVKQNDPRCDTKTSKTCIRGNPQNLHLRAEIKGSFIFQTLKIMSPKSKISFWEIKKSENLANHHKKIKSLIHHRHYMCSKYLICASKRYPTYPLHSGLISIVVCGLQP